MELLLIAFALAMDSVALSISNGAKYPNFKFTQIARVAFFYAAAQFIMPLAGYALGINFVKFIAQIDHFVAFGILSFLGIKMIIESRREQDEPDLRLSTKELVLGAIATSIDAMAMGVTFAFGEINILYACCVIGLVCFVLCVAACYAGKLTGEYLHSKALVLGGAILILIGVKILLSHLGVIYI
nr:manganese efflux pump MntP family protein [uncultured Campylobacter sp.]